MSSGKKLLTVILFLFILTIISGTSYAAKSVYVISDTQTSRLYAYKIDGTNLIYQTDYNCSLDPPDDAGAVGLVIDESEYGDFLFVTFEFLDKIELINAKAMQYVDTVTASGASDLAGIAMDKSKSKLYAVDRYTNYLYSYTWNPATKKLIPDFNDPYYIELEGLEYEQPYGAFGIALDEENGLLYVADNTNTIKYYSTNDWSKLGEITASCNVISVAIDVNNQFLYYGSMGRYGEEDPHLYKYNISAHTESSVNVGCSVAGIVVDQATSLVYLTTFGDNDDTLYPNPPQDRLIIYNSNLVKQPWESGDIGNPAGVCVPSGDVSYKPPLFYLEKVDVNEPNCVIPDDYITYRITYGPNGVDHNNVVLTDFLPDELVFISSSGPNSVYNPSAHTVTWQIGPRQHCAICVKKSVSSAASATNLSILRNSSE
jgi:uncharacterized repeat protein (TIGR01451 family)